MNAAVWRLRVLLVLVWVFSQCEEENVGLIGDTRLPAGVSASIKRSVLSKGAVK